MPVGFIIWSLASFVLVCRGICSRKSKGAVRFFTAYRAPWVNDIKKYNNAISILSIIGGVVLEIIGIPISRKASSSVLLVVTIAAGVWLIILTVIYEIIRKKCQR